MFQFLPIHKFHPGINYKFINVVSEVVVGDLIPPQYWVVTRRAIRTCRSTAMPYNATH